MNKLVMSDNRHNKTIQLFSSMEKAKTYWEEYLLENDMEADFHTNTNTGDTEVFGIDPATGKAVKVGHMIESK